MGASGTVRPYQVAKVFPLLVSGQWWCRAFLAADVGSDRVLVFDPDAISWRRGVQQWEVRDARRSAVL